MNSELVYAAKGLAEALAAVKLLDMAPRNAVVGLGVAAVGESPNSQWYIYANFSNVTREYLATAETMLNAWGSKSDLSYTTLLGRRI